MEGEAHTLKMKKGKGTRQESRNNGFFAEREAIFFGEGNRNETPRGPEAGLLRRKRGNRREISCSLESERRVR